MRILLATPKPRDGFTPYGPPLGLCYLAAVLKQNGYADIAGVDLNVEEMEVFTEAVRHADIVGIYSSTKAYRISLEMAQVARDAGCCVVLGGPHPTLCPDEVVSHPAVDFIVRGDGEFTFLELVRGIDSKADDFSSIDGISYRSSSGRVVHNRPRDLLKNLDDLPFPDQTVFKMARYPAVDINICASRGCPYKCANCQPGLNAMSGRFRRRSVENVLEEIEALTKDKNWRGYIHFVDNDMTISRKWIEALCRGMIDRKLGLRWACEGRANTLDKELMLLLKEAGCRMIGMGVESGSERVLKDVIYKGATLQQAFDVVNWANEVGLEVHCWFILGIPGETLEEMRQTVAAASRMEAASIGFSIGTPWPGTIFYDICKANGYMLSTDWDDYNEKRKCTLKTEHFGPEDVAAVRAELFEVFRDKGWRVDEATFIMQNPHYNRTLKGKAFFLAQSILYSLVGHHRAVRLYSALMSLRQRVRR